MQLNYSSPTIDERDTYFDGVSQINCTSTSGQLIREAIHKQLEQYTTALAAENLYFHLLDRISGSPDKFLLKSLATSNDALLELVPSDDEATDLSWLFLAYQSREMAQPSVKSLTDYIQGINGLIKKGKFDLLAKILSSTALSDMSNEAMITFARALYPVRERIPNWKKFVLSVKNELDNRGKDGARLLRGIV